MKPFLFFFLNCFILSLPAVGLPKNPPTDLEILFYKPQGMSGRGFRLIMNQSIFTLEEKEFSSVKTFSDTMDPNLWIELYESLKANQIQRIRLESGFLHDYDSYSIQLRWNEGKNSISVVQSGQKVRRSDSKNYENIVTDFLKVKESLGTRINAP
jgi:hypothetical protein